MSSLIFTDWLGKTIGKEKVPLSKIAQYKNGLAMQKYRPNEYDKGLPVLKIRELNQGFSDSSSDRCASNISEDIKVDTGDIIFSWSGTLLLKIWSGKLSGLNQHLFKVTSNVYPKWFYYEWTKYFMNEFQEIASDKATTMGHIKRSDLNNSMTIIPTKGEMEQLNIFLSSIMDKRINLIKQNISLKELKENLMEKILSN